MIKFFSNFKIIFYSINFSLIFLYLFPGSLIGYVVYGSKKIQPQITPDFIISSNHFYVFVLISMLPLVLILRKSPERNETSPVSSTIDDKQRSNTIIASIGLTPFAMQIILSIASIGCCVAMSLPLAHLVAHMSDIGYGAAHGAQLISLMLMAAGVSSFFGVGQTLQILS